MHWYQQQKEAISWSHFLGAPKLRNDNGTPNDGGIESSPVKPRSKVEIEADKKRIMIEMNQFRGPRRGEPGAKERVDELQKQYQALLLEGSLLHELAYKV